MKSLHLELRFFRVAVDVSECLVPHFSFAFTELRVFSEFAVSAVQTKCHTVCFFRVFEVWCEKLYFAVKRQDFF